MINRPSAPRDERRVEYPGFDFGSPAYTPAEGAAAAAASVGLDATLQAIDEQGHVVSAIPVHFRRRVTVGDTATLLGTDASGAIRVIATARREPPSFSLNLHYLSGSPAIPRELLSSFRFLRALHRPRRLGVLIGDRPVGEPDVLPAGTEFPQSFLEVVRSLAFVQAASGDEFPLQSELGPDDLRSLAEAEALLLGETVSSRWSDATLGLSTIDTELLNVVEGDRPFRLEFVAPVVAVIAGHDVTLGDAHYVFRTAVLENYSELVQASESDDMSEATAYLRPGEDDGFEVTLENPPPIGLDLQDVRPPATASSDALDRAREASLSRDAFRHNAAS